MQTSMKTSRERDRLWGTKYRNKDRGHKRKTQEGRIQQKRLKTISSSSKTGIKKKQNIIF